MMRVLFILALLLFASPAYAQCYGDRCSVPMTTDAAYGVRYAKEQVVELPQDGDKPYLTVFGNVNDSRFAQVQKWFATDETLIAIKNQCHFNVIATNSIEFRDMFASNTPATLVVRMQAKDVDAPVVELIAAQVPMSADALARHLNTKASSAECFRRRAPKNQQVVIVNPGRADPPAQPLPPPGKKPPKSAPIWPISIGLTLLAAGVGGYLGIRKEWKAKHIS